jgi:hypothetical protein
MILSPITPLSEEYFCTECNRFFSYLDVFSDWECPIHKDKIQIKVTINNESYCAVRVRPHELRIGELVTLENQHFHEVLDIKSYQNYQRVALKGYTAINIDADSIITKIIGGWYHSLHKTE